MSGYIPYWIDELIVCERCVGKSIRVVAKIKTTITEKGRMYMAVDPLDETIMIPISTRKHVTGGIVEIFGTFMGEYIIVDFFMPVDIDESELPNYKSFIKYERQVLLMD